MIRRVTFMFSNQTGHESDFTIFFIAPFYNRSGYGQGARSLIKYWLDMGIRIRIHSVNDVEEGIDDFDLNLIRSLETTPVVGKVVAVFYHVPSQQWLDVKLPSSSLRIMFTTFEGAVHGEDPPQDWVRICNNMDLVFLTQHSEVAAWCRAGLNAQIVRLLKVTPGWVDNHLLPPVSFGMKTEKFRFLTIAMYQPRRRWDTLFEAFCQEFADEPNAELYVKVNYPSWHPVPNQPKADLEKLLTDIRNRYVAGCRIIIDEDLGSRLGICNLIDSSSCYVSTDTTATAPVSESLIRGRAIVIPASHQQFYPPEPVFLIEEDADYKITIDQKILNYQPHHKGSHQPLLRICHVRSALRKAYSDKKISMRHPWDGWSDWVQQIMKSQLEFNQSLFKEIKMALEDKNVRVASIQVSWEGTQFAYHSLAHVNRELCKRLLESGKVNLSLVPYEQDTFDPRVSMPSAIPLMWRVRAPLERTDVHVRHQWPPNFIAPAEGAWVIIQPWEYGGIPLDWVSPMRDSVDEIWVPTNWVRECYIKSGIPGEKVFTIPNGVDTALFNPEGERVHFKTAKKFKFLYLGGLIHRKGFDLVINAYLNAFQKSDDVCLIIKGASGTYGPETEFVKFLENVRATKQNSPEIEFISESMTEDRIASIYRSCDVLVHPYRGEGFGLPIAEALASGLPVIVTDKGAAGDFVRSEFAYFVSSSQRGTAGDHGFEPAAPGFWLQEPNIEALIEAMRSAFGNQNEVSDKGRLARQYAEKNLTWDIAVRKILERTIELSQKTPIRFIEKPRAILIEYDSSTPAWMEATIISIKELITKQQIVVLFLVKQIDRAAFNETFFNESFLSACSNLIGSQVPDFRIIETVEKFMNVARSFVFDLPNERTYYTRAASGVSQHEIGTDRQELIAFIFEPDWVTQNWTEILISYLVEFRYAEPVALVFPIKSSDLSFVNVNLAAEMISATLSQTGDTQFPDIIVIDTVDEMYEVAKKYHLQWVDKQEGSTIGLNGRVGHRLGKARLLLQAAKDGGS